MMNTEQFAPFAQRMEAAGLPRQFIELFAYYYQKLLQGETGLLPEDTIEPVPFVPDMERFDPALTDVGKRALAHTAVIKLNGGLGTSMGLEQAKALLPVKEGLSFLDIIARQVTALDIPLLLMNSFSTDADSMSCLAAYPQLAKGVPQHFLQHKAPKVVQSDFTPVVWPQNEELEWCPPGHGDIYTALMTSGTLEALLAAGYEYAFVSNADNLGALLDPTLLGYFVRHQLPFMMEVADRKEMDRKGGHLAQRPDGQLVLRELAQCPATDQAAFQDISRHKYFNTNNLWFNLRVVQEVMMQSNGRLGLPMIRNSKTVDPRDPASTPVYQLETAMGAAIGVFAGAQAVRVPRTRFAPVKTTDDLLAVRSDAYRLTEQHHVLVENSDLLVMLDAAHYRFVNQLDAAFPAGPPSLRDCTQFLVQGPFVFGCDVVCRGDVRLVNEGEQAVQIADGAVLTGTYSYGRSS
jgi:UTP--glucose-1-phosphate uridylyltransferase